MVKKLIKIAVVLLLLAIIAVVALGFFIGPAVTKTVNTLGPRVTGTQVELASTQLSLFTGGGQLNGLLVGNPEGWRSDKAFYLGEIRVKIAPASLLGDYVLVKEIFINQPEFVYETRLTSSNIGDLLKQIEENLGPSKPATGEDKPAGEPMKFAIESFRLQGARVTLGVGAAAATITLPPITLENLGVAQGGITADQVAAAALKAVLQSIVRAAAGAITNLGGSGIEGVGDATKQATDGVRRLFGRD